MMASAVGAGDIAEGCWPRAGEMTAERTRRHASERKSTIGVGYVGGGRIVPGMKSGWRVHGGLSRPMLDRKTGTVEKRVRFIVAFDAIH
jgi:hypothetical protein